MRIALQTNTSTYWLAGEDGVAESVHSSARDFTLTGERQLGVEQLVKTAFTKQFDRESQTNEVTFGTSRTFATSEACFLFELDYSENIPLEGSIIFEIPLPGGGVTRRYMANAVMQRPEMDPIGVSLTLEFSISGGIISAGLGHYLTGTGDSYLNGSGGNYLTGT